MAHESVFPASSPRGLQMGSFVTNVSEINQVHELIKYHHILHI